MHYKLSDMIKKFGGRLLGEDVCISGIQATHLAKKSDITFLTHKKYRNKLSECGAGAIIVAEKDAENLKIPAIVSDNPYWYFSKVSQLFHPRRRLAAEIHPRAIVDSTAVLGEACAISANVCIGAQTKLGHRCQVYPNVTIGDNVVIGDDVTVFPNVTIYDHVVIGNQVTIHAGSVIGSDGFGYAEDNNKHWSKIPQVGGVVIGDSVEIGANTVIDSGTLTPTVIEKGVIIDNLVQLAHNTHIGAHSAIAGLAGIAGGTKIGKHCRIGGGSGINGHIEICDYAVVGGETAVAQSITTPDLYMAAYPLMPYKAWAKSTVHIKNLENLNERVKALEEKK